MSEVFREASNFNDFEKCEICKKAQSELINKDYNACIKIINRFFNLKKQNVQPKFNYLLFLRGISKFKIKDFQGALLDLRKVNISDPRLFYYRGRSAHCLFKDKEAISNYEECLAIYPKELTRNLFITLFENDILKDVISKQRIYFAMGESFRRIEQIDIAESYFNLALDMDLGTYDSYFCRGSILAKFFRDYSSAVKEFSKAINLEKNPQPYFYRSWCYEYLNDFECALSDANQALKHSVQHRQFIKYLWSRALIKFELKDYIGYLHDIFLGFIRDPFFIIIRLFRFYSFWIRRKIKCMKSKFVSSF